MEVEQAFRNLKLTLSFKVQAPFQRRSYSLPLTCSALLAGAAFGKTPEVNKELTWPRILNQMQLIHFGEFLKKSFSQACRTHE